MVIFYDDWGLFVALDNTFIIHWETLLSILLLTMGVVPLCAGIDNLKFYMIARIPEYHRIECAAFFIMISRHFFC